MVLGQFSDETVRRFIARINEAFDDRYGSRQNSRFKRATKKNWLLEGLKQSITDALNDDLVDEAETWPEIQAVVQDAEWLAALRFKRNNYVGKYADRYLYDDDDFVVEDGSVVVYTDGACLRNGYEDAQAGIGVWFNYDSEM